MSLITMPFDSTLVTVCKNLSTAILGPNYTCQFCKRGLTEGNAYIQISESECVKVSGFYCKGCKKLYFDSKHYDFSELKNIIANSSYAKEYSLNWRYYNKLRHNNNPKKEKYSYGVKTNERYKKLLNKTKSSIFVLSVNYSRQTSEYIIVKSKNEECVEKNILYYHNAFARTLLAAWFVSQNHKCTFSNKEYRVAFCFPRKKKSRKRNGKCIIPGQIVLKSKGGIYESDKDKEIVEILLYSPFNKRYEIINATYAPENNEYYIAPSNLRKFVENYCNPGVKVGFKLDKNNETYFDWNKVNTESLLKAWGYTVNQIDDKSTSERRKALTDLVDLKIAEVSYIVYMLDFFIQTHTGDCFFEARQKWASDREFMVNYKINPTRFLIQRPGN